MPDQISTATPGVDAGASPQLGTPAPQSGNGQLGGEATGQSATPSETFLPQGLDINTLPPHIRQHVEKINADMVRGFTEKTSKLSETVKSETQKAVEAYRQKAEFYDQLLTQEEFVKQWNSHVEKVAQSQAAQSDDPAMKLEKKVQALEAQVMKSATAEAIDAFASTVDEKGAKKYSDFDKLNSIAVTEIDNGDGTKREVSMLGVAIDAAPGKTIQEKLTNGYNTAKKVYDAIFEEGKKAGMGRVQTKLANGSLPPSVSAPVSGPSRRPRNALEALQFARAGLPVHKD